MKNLLVCIDGSSLLSTSFYATLDRRYHMEKSEEGKQAYLDKLLRTSDGQIINGVYGMVKSIEAMLRKVQPSHLVIAWDISRDTFRRDIYPEYKAQRSETLPELKGQFLLAQQLFSELGASQYSFKAYEADDVIGTLTRQFEEDIPIAIWTKDQDAIQLISERTSLWLVTSKAKDMYLESGSHPHHHLIPTGVFEHNPFTIEEYYGIRPEQIIDVKAIEGDPSDNIPGISGVGTKTVLPLIKEFGDLEGIYDYLEGDSAQEMKAFFKELGISSPLKKMMDEVMAVDIVPEIIEFLKSETIAPLNDKSLEVLDITQKASLFDLVNLEVALNVLDEKELKKIYKILAKDACLSEIVSKVGEFKPGKAKELAFICKQLATIKRDIPELNDVSLDTLRYNIPDELKEAIFEKYEFRSLIG